MPAVALAIAGGAQPPFVVGAERHKLAPGNVTMTTASLSAGRAL